MRTFLCILLVGWLWLPFAARGQNPTIVAAEYFLDTDPGVGGGKAFPFPPSANPNVQLQVSLQGLPTGFHTLSVRFKDSNDFWSLARTRVFLIESPEVSIPDNTLTGLEYFINTDPGPGKGTKVNITAGTEASVAIPVTLSGLPEGFHTIGMRFQDQNGNWSLVKNRLFFIQNSITKPPLLPITAAEYFIDTDPGPGLGKALSVSPGNNPQVVGNIPTTGLAPGFHIIGTRFKSQDNTWGLAKSRLFYVGDANLNMPVMVDFVEYFFDGSDPGEGKATSIPLTQPASAISVESLIAVASLPKGSHTITVRIRDNRGMWSRVVTEDFIVGDPKFTTPPVPDLGDLPNLEVQCVINLTDLTVPTAKAEDGTPVIGTVNESLFPITKQGNTEITWTYTDSNGLKATQKQMVILKDTEAPALIAPAKVSINLIQNQCSISNVSLGDATASDNCGNPTVTNNAPAVFGIGKSIVTWTATDAAGNQVQATQEVEVLDVTPPTISAPVDVNIRIPIGVDVAGNVILGQPVYADNCGVQTIENNAPILFPLGVTNVTWKVTDRSGNAATAIQLVTVSRQVLPTITAPPAIKVNADQGKCFAIISDLGDPNVTGEDIAGDGISNDAPDEFPIGETTVTWTVEDGNGNSASATQTVTVTDAEKPVVAAPASVSVDAGQGACNAQNVTLGQPTVSDNCGISSVTNNGLNTYPVGMTTVTWTVTDDNGNISTATQTVTVLDKQVPLITAPTDLTVQILPGENNASGVSLGQPTVSDNCSVASVTTNAPALFPIGQTAVTWTVTDASGNTNSDIQLVTVTQAEVPTIIAPKSINVSADQGTCSATVSDLGTPTVTGDDIPSNGITNDAPSVFPIGETVVTWKVTDGKGLTASALQLVTVEDEEDPGITAPADMKVNTVSGKCEAMDVALGDPSVSDNCAVVSVSNDAPDIFPIGETVVTWTVTDVSGNTATATQKVTVEDKEAPTISAPGNLTVQVDLGSSVATNVNLGGPTVSDNCKVANTGNDAPDSFPVGITTVTWTVTDASGNAATATQTVTVLAEESELPTITPPANVSVNTDQGACEATGVNIGTASFTGDIPVGGLTNDAPESFPIGKTTVTWIVKDDKGNTASATQTITVTDDQKPIISAPANVIIGTDAGDCSAGPVDLGQPVVSDNCSVQSVSNNAPVTFPLGETQVVWTVVDGSGNSATAVQSVTVKDEEDPTITAPADLKVNTVSGKCEAMDVALGDPSVSDNCAVASVSNDAPDIFPTGETVVTWTVTDVSGNTATAIQKVTVEDNEAPSISAPGNLTVQVDLGSSVATNVNLGGPTVSDNCKVANTGNDAPDSFPVGITTVTWTVTDASGNAATAVQTVTVLAEESELPTITPPANVSVNAAKGLCGASNVDIGFATFTGNIPDGGVTNDAPPVFPLGQTVVTWTVTDSNGNVVKATQTVTVSDKEAPSIKAPADVLLEIVGEHILSAEVDLGSPIYSDNCKVASVKNNAPSRFKVGTTVVKWTVTDESGNVCTAKQNVVVSKKACTTIAKAIPEITLRLNSMGKAKLNPSMADAGSTSDCGPVKLELSKCDFTCADIGEHIVKLYAKDKNGNKVNTKFKVIVVDERKPKVAVDQTPFVWMMQSGDTFVMPDFRDKVTASDNCSYELTQFPAPGTVYKKPENCFIEFEARDPSGNKAKTKFSFKLVVFKCKARNKKSRETEEVYDNLLTVPWNTPFESLVAEGIEFEEGSDPEAIRQIKWTADGYDPLSPGFYQLHGALTNLGFTGRDVTVQVPVLVQNKPMPEDIVLSNNVVSKKARSGEIIGGLQTIDPVDNIHSYSMEANADYEIMQGALVWKGEGMPPLEVTLRVSSTDRAGQTISRAIKVFREMDAPIDALIYPNPATSNTNIHIRMIQGSKVGIRIFDAAGRQVYEESGLQEGSFTRSLDIRGYAAGMYQVIIQVDQHYITKRLVKE